MQLSEVIIASDNKGHNCNLVPYVIHKAQGYENFPQPNMGRMIVIRLGENSKTHIHTSYFFPGLSSAL